MTIARIVRSALVAAVVLAVPAMPASADDAARRAEQIRRQTGVRGGLVVHLVRAKADKPHVSDADLTAALAGESYLVHALSPDSALVTLLRETIRARAQHGRASIDVLTGNKLPHASNLVQLLVADELGAVPMSEVLRVLSPGGVAWIGGKVTRKFRTSAIDEWTHYLHDASNNAVADDSVVNQPRRLQWLAGPKWQRSHDHLASTSAVVSAGGRIFSIIDEAPIAHVVLPARWMLVARDAFSGVLLWKRPIASWEGHLRGFRSGPTELARRLVAVGDRVYVTLGYGEPISVLDAATGKGLMTVEGTDNALEIVYRKGTLLAVVGDRVPDNVDNAAIPAKPQEVWMWWAIFQETPPTKRIMAFDAESGKRLWEKNDDDTASMMPTTLAAAGGRVFFHSPSHVIALDEASGNELWRAKRPVATDRPSWSAPTLVVSGDVVLSGDRAVKAPINRRGPAAGPGWTVNTSGGHSPVGELIAFSARDGKRLWSCPCREVYNAPPDVLVVDGVVWTGSLVHRKDPGITEGRDLRTGKVVRRRGPDQFPIRMGHHRCYRNKATSRFLVLGRDGIEFIDLATGKGEQNAWVRGACQYGVMPCNGLVYSPPHSCACHIEIKLDSFLALAPRGDGEPNAAVDDDERLVRGEAYGNAVATRNSRLDAPDPEWPTYRHDGGRSGKAGCEAPTQLGARWLTHLSTGRITSPVAAGGKVFVACADERCLVALSAAGGRKLWCFNAGGPVDSPPTIHEGLVIFGCADGRIYCLRAADGKPVWTYLAAPVDRRVVVRGRVESAWPVSGSVLVLDGVVYAVAGRSSFLDGGMYFVGLDPHSGKQIVRRRIEQDGLSDVLASDGESIYLRGMKLDKTGAASGQPGPHLFSPAGFLDDTWWHRTYWLFGTRIGSGWGGWPGAGNAAPSGRLLVADGQAFYGFGRMNQLHRDGAHPGLGQTRYQLYACTTQTPASKAQTAATKAPTKARNQARRTAPKRPGPARPKMLWSVPAEIEARGMVLAGSILFVAGPPNFLAKVDEANKGFPYYIEASEQDLTNQRLAMEGKKGGRLLAISTAGGEKIAEVKLPAPPVFDGLIAANGRLIVCTMDGHVVCLGGK